MLNKRYFLGVVPDVASLGYWHSTARTVHESRRRAKFERLSAMLASSVFCVFHAIAIHNSVDIGLGGPAILGSFGESSVAFCPRLSAGLALKFIVHPLYACVADNS